ncbi:alpha/beta fold hydrolase [Ferrovibrio sp.]|uniref:alpha/beta hydrolase family protein n=1 Tax=Ferrovibrio sp. TaxID=1917215 RepID=UPI0035133892
MTNTALHTAEIVLATPDSQHLAATLFEPGIDGPPANGLSVLVNGATGVPARYYAAFAQFLAGRGFTVLTYDYRGIAGSRRRGAGAPPPRMLDWGRHDMPAAAAWLRRHRPGLGRCVVGHSFGGQILGLDPQAGEIAAAVTIAAQHGHWRNWDWAHRLYLPAWWYLMVPGIVAATGRLPGRLLGGAEDLPAGVARDWARWCRSRHYLVDDEGRPLRPHNHAVRATMRLVSFADDHTFGPRRGVDALAGFYPHARIERLHVAPGDWGLPQIGHFGFFRRGMPPQRWAELADWLYAAATASREEAA